MSGRRSLTLVTGPAADPVILAEVKQQANIEGTDWDPLLAQYITAATQSAQEYLRRALITQTWKLTLDLSCSGLDRYLGEGVYDLPSTVLYGELPRVIRLPRQPIQTISSVKTYDTSNAETTYSSSNYYLDTAGGRLVLNQGSLWPSGMRPEAAAAITFVAGYGDTSTSIPQPIKTGISMHAQRMFDTRIMCDMPEDCKYLMRQYRVMDAADG